LLGVSILIARLGPPLQRRGRRNPLCSHETKYTTSDKHNIQQLSPSLQTQLHPSYLQKAPTFGLPDCYPDTVTLVESNRPPPRHQPRAHSLGCTCTTTPPLARSSSRTAPAPTSTARSLGCTTTPRPPALPLDLRPPRLPTARLSPATYPKCARGSGFLLLRFQSVAS
jgi:hypothetical protein